MAKPEVLEELPEDYGPIECEECGELCAVEATNVCRHCEATVCDWCWSKHMKGHANAK